MTAGSWVSLIVGLVGSVSLIVVMLGNSKTSLARINVQNAKEITDQYKAMNDSMRIEFDNKFKEMQVEIDAVKKENKEMADAFKKRENFLESEIEIRDIRIGKLEGIIIVKDSIIAKLKGGKNDE